MKLCIVLNFHRKRHARAMSWSLSVVVALLVTVLAAAQSASGTEPAPWWAWGTAPYALEVPTDMAQLCDAIWAQSSTSQPAQFALARAQVCVWCAVWHTQQSSLFVGPLASPVMCRYHLASRGRCAAESWFVWPTQSTFLASALARTCMHCTNIAASVIKQAPCRHPLETPTMPVWPVAPHALANRGTLTNPFSMRVYDALSVAIYV